MIQGLIEYGRALLKQLVPMGLDGEKHNIYFS